MQNYAFDRGAKVGFSRGDPTLLLEDLRALKPTIFIAVPLVCNRIYEQAWFCCIYPNHYCFFPYLSSLLSCPRDHQKLPHEAFQ